MGQAGLYLFSYGGVIIGTVLDDFSVRNLRGPFLLQRPRQTHPELTGKQKQSLSLFFFCYCCWVFIFIFLNHWNKKPLCLPAASCCEGCHLAPGCGDARSAPRRARLGPRSGLPPCDCVWTRGGLASAVAAGGLPAEASRWCPAMTWTSHRLKEDRRGIESWRTFAGTIHLLISERT